MGGLQRVRRYTGRPTSSRVATIARKSFPLAHASTRARDSSGTAAFTLVPVPVALRDDEAGGVLARCEEGGSPGGSSNERCGGRGVSCIPSCSSSESRGTSASGVCRADCARACCGQRWCRLQKKSPVSNRAWVPRTLNSSRFYLQVSSNK